MFRKTSLAVLAAATALTALPTAAGAQRYGYSGYYGSPYRNGYYGSPYRYSRTYAPSGYYQGRNYNYYGRRHYRHNCNSGTTGAIIGAVAGGLLGREIARSGSRYSYYRRGSQGTTGAIIGAGAGALLGREIARNC